MVYCNERKIIFVHIPKTAGSSMERFLGLMKPQNGYKRAKGRLKAEQHYLWYDYEKNFNFEKYFKFTICRNPYTRFISEYFWCQITGAGFKYKKTVDQFLKFCEDKVASKCYNKSPFDDHIMPQWMFVFNEKGEQMVDFIGRFEDLESTIKLIREKYGIKSEFPRINCSSRKLELTKEQKERIYNLYKKDFELFGYEK